MLFSLRHRPLPRGRLLRPIFQQSLLSQCRNARSVAASVQHRPYHVVFFGSDHFSLETLRQLHALRERQMSMLACGHNIDKRALVESLEVVCPVDRPAGRGQRLTPAPVKSYALEHALPVHHPSSLHSLRDWQLPQLASQQQPDLAIVVSFRYFIPRRILDCFRVGAINLHPSLLPQYRGPAPLHWPLLNGDAETGVSVIKLHPDRFDAGDILQQETIPLQEHTTYTQLYEQTRTRGAQMLVSMIESGNMEQLLQNARKQDLEGEGGEAARVAGVMGNGGSGDASPTPPAVLQEAPKVNKSMAQMMWSQEGARTLYNKYRALADNVKVYSFMDRPLRRFIIREAVAPTELSVPALLRDHEHQVKPGTMFFDRQQFGDLLLVRCVDGWLGLRRVQLESRAVVDAEAFVRGQADVDRITEPDTLPPALQSLVAFKLEEQPAISKS